MGKVVGQDRFILQEIDKHAVEGAFTDFDVNRAALWQGKNKMFDVGRNDNNITGLHFNCLCFDPVPAFATQSVNNFKKIVLMGGNIQILRHIVELYIAILRNMVLLVEQVGSGSVDVSLHLSPGMDGLLRFQIAKIKILRTGRRVELDAVHIKKVQIFTSLPIISIPDLFIRIQFGQHLVNAL